MKTTSMQTLLDQINKVKTFHTAFGIENRESPTADLTEKEIKLRYELMKEENEEYFDACKDGDVVEIADALGDMMYILFGTMLSHGMQYKIEEVFNEIQRSNMSKLDINGDPIYREDGKVLKSDLYFRPDIASIIR